MEDRPSSRGSALVYVMVTAILMALASAMIFKAVFGSRVVAQKAINATQADYWAKSCLALKSAAWKNTACADTAPCDFSPTGPIVKVTCSGSNVTFSVE